MSKWTRSRHARRSGSAHWGRTNYSPQYCAIIVSPYSYRGSLSVIDSELCNCPPVLTSWCQYLPRSPREKKKRGGGSKKKKKRRERKALLVLNKERRKWRHPPGFTYPGRRRQNVGLGANKGRKVSRGKAARRGFCRWERAPGRAGSRPNIAPGCCNQEAVAHRITLLCASRLGRRFPLSEAAFRSSVGGAGLPQASRVLELMYKCRKGTAKKTHTHTNLQHI